MRQNPIRRLGATFPVSSPIPGDSASDHVVGQETVNPLERRITIQGNKKPPPHVHTQLTGASKGLPARNINGVGGVEDRDGEELSAVPPISNSNYYSTAFSQSPWKKPHMSSQTTGDQGLT